MNDTERVRLAQRAADLLRDVNDAVLREGPLLSQVVLESTAVQIFHSDEKDSVARATVVVERDRVRVGELRGDRSLEVEALGEAGILAFADAQHPERDHAIERGLQSQSLVDPAHPALADLLHDPVPVVDDAPQKRIEPRARGMEIRSRLPRHPVVLRFQIWQWPSPEVSRLEERD